MRVLSRFVAFAVLLCLVGVVSFQAESTGSFYNKGKKAEEKGDYDSAYVAYKQAFDKKPSDLKLRAAYLRVKGLASAEHVKRGLKLRDDGNLAEAIVEFQHAEEIDPSNFLADQELHRTQNMLSGPPKQTRNKVLTPIERRLEEAQGPVDLEPISNDSITLRISNDSKTVYTTIGKIAGLNVIFDPEYSPKPISLDLNKVSLNDALSIIGTLSNTFWKPITSNTIFVAANNQQKRKELEDNVVKTFYLSNLSQPTELQDVVNALRNILELRYVFPINSQQTIVVRGTPDQLAVAEKIIEDMDKAKPEVVIDVKVLSVSRRKVRTLGILPPTSVTAALQPLTGSGTGSGSNGLSLNDLGNLSAKNFAISIPAATANVDFTDSDTKLLQNPQVRASDGEKATLKIGSRIPIATGSFGAPTGTAGLSLVSNTQFQYIDLGVNVDITPKVHANDEITMKLVLDISSQNGTATIGGVVQPIIAQNKMEHTVRVKEGEVTVLGGFLEQQDQKSLEGLPFLSQVPLLKYLFSSSTTDKLDTQILFVLTPRVVRSLEFTDRNLAAISIGTANGLELRRVSKAQAQPAPTPQPNVAQPVPSTQSQAVTSAPMPATTPIQTAPLAQPGQLQPGQSTQPTQPTVPSDQQSPALRFDPPATTTQAGQTFSVNINLVNAQDVYSVPLEITYNPNVVSIVDASSGDFLQRDGQLAALVHRDDGAGTLTISATRPPGVPGISGSGTIVTIKLQAKAAGQSVLAIAKQGARNSAQQQLVINGAMTMVTVQ